jgi:hypothetical protein
MTFCGLRQILQSIQSRKGHDNYEDVNKLERQS